MLAELGVRVPDDAEVRVWDSSGLALVRHPRAPGRYRRPIRRRAGPARGLHPSCVTDEARLTFDADWQRRAFGLPVARSEFGHYPWAAFQKELIDSIGGRQDAPARSRWEYHQYWVSALGSVVDKNGLLEEGYVNPEDREDGVKHAG